jgi:ribonuclease P protein component
LICAQPLSFGFPRQYRLHHPAEFQAVLRAPGFATGRGALRILANPNTMPGARLGMIVGKRAVRRAHDRNRIKRIVRETFRRHRPHLPAVDIVVQVRGSIGEGDLSRELEAGLSRLHRNN